VKADSDQSVPKDTQKDIWVCEEHGRQHDLIW
ncbi:hypothetical protein LCGC14_2664470, partial [marine sediment metagenome]